MVHKFGGTSVGDAKGYRQVATILRGEKDEKKAIVVSAMDRVTDALIELVDLAKTRNNAYLCYADALKARHLDVIETLLPSESRQSLIDALECDFKDIKDLLRGVYLSRTYSDRTIELISGHGELWSAQFLNAHLNAMGIASSWLDARTLLIVEPGDAVSVDWECTKSQTAKWLETPRRLPNVSQRLSSEMEATFRPPSSENYWMPA